MNNQLVFLVVLCLAEFLHNTVEVWGVRRKVSWLARVQNGLDHNRNLLNVSTKIKALIFHLLILALFSCLFFFILRVLDLSERNLIVVGIIALLANYVIATWQVDSYHTHIGQLITRAKKTND